MSNWAGIGFYFGWPSIYDVLAFTEASMRDLLASFGVVDLGFADRSAQHR
jgi:hypothetical protein